MSKKAFVFAAIAILGSSEIARAGAARREAQNASFVRPSAASPVDSLTELGPKSERAERYISDADVKIYAEGAGMTFSDASWLLRVGTTELLDFQSGHAKDERFGAVWTTTSAPLEIHLRVTQDAPDLAAGLAELSHHPVKVKIGGASFAYLKEQFEEVSDQMVQVTPKQITLDLIGGVVRFETNRRNVSSVASIKLPADVVFTLSDIEPVRAASYAGAEMNASTCTTGYAVRRNSDNWRGIVTAGHCPANNTSYGYNLWPQEQQVCTYSDRQVHPTTATYIWNGFFTMAGQWTTIAGVAGGWLSNQPFMRKGRVTSAAGNIGPYTEFGVGGGDCGAYSVRGFPLYNSSGGAVAGGDSGGPLMLAYNNQWFLGGITSGQPGGGNSGYSAWINVPSGWTACTGANPSCVG